MRFLLVIAEDSLSAICQSLDNYYECWCCLTAYYLLWKLNQTQPTKIYL